MIGIAIKHFTTIIDYSMTIPRTNASVERIFSFTNVLWTGKKNRFVVDTIKSIIIVKHLMYRISHIHFEKQQIITNHKQN